MLARERPAPKPVLRYEGVDVNPGDRKAQDVPGPVPTDRPSGEEVG